MGLSPSSCFLHFVINLLFSLWEIRIKTWPSIPLWKKVINQQNNHTQNLSKYKNTWQCNFIQSCYNFFMQQGLKKNNLSWHILFVIIVTNELVTTSQGFINTSDLNFYSSSKAVILVSELSKTRHTSKGTFAHQKLHWERNTHAYVANI